ncbi:2'-5' RNA ligase family protein [Halobacteriaceae archaeon GCM10025711]
MFSLNVPVPAAVDAVADDLAPDLAAFDAVRDQRTLVVKRLPVRGAWEYRQVEARARDALAGTPAFEARVAAIDVFDDAAMGSTPVVYLAVESPVLRDLHDRLARTFELIDGIEGDDYVPHVTLARGGARDVADRLAGRDVGPVTWTVEELAFWDARHGEQVSAVSLPARGAAGRRPTRPCRCRSSASRT